MASGTIKAVLSKDEFDSMGGLSVDISFTIPSNGWTSVSPYTYTWTNSAVTSGCHVEVEFGEGAENTTISHLGFEKVSGGVQFTAPEKPSENIPVVVHITHVDSDLSLTGAVVSTNVISGASNVDEALTSVNTNLGSPSSASGVTGSDAFSKINTLNSKVNKTYCNAAYTVVDTLTSGTQKTINITEDGWYIVRAQNGGTSGNCYAGAWTDWGRSNLIGYNSAPAGNYTRATIGPYPLKKGTAIVAMCSFTDSGDVIKLTS